MSCAGIICEYNPFHNGHQLQLQKTREMLGSSGAIICLMSGYYVQRGEPALYPPLLRAEAAVKGGADLVLELPLTIAVNSAGYFASGAVECFQQLGIIDFLSFGSEAGQLDALVRTAAALDHPDTDSAIGTALQSGCSYAAARSLALNSMGLDGELLKFPNNALGVEYIRAICRLDSSIKPWTFAREMTLPSASEIRNGLTLGSCAPYDLPFGGTYQNAPMHHLRYGEKAMLAVLRSLPEKRFAEMAFESEGIWKKVMKACRQEPRLEDILLACKSKRFAYSRLQRTLLCLFLGLTQEKLNTAPLYLRVLAFNRKGRVLLAQARKASAIPLLTNGAPKDASQKDYYRMECQAADLYPLFAAPGNWESLGALKRHRPWILEE